VRYQKGHVMRYAVHTLEDGIGLLSGREREVFRLVLEAYSNQEIAAKLNLSHSGLKYHKTNIFKKLEIPKQRANKTFLLLKRFGRFEVTFRWVPNTK
jgi:DNA-binding CsgD family transcriptional regulator